MKVQSKKIGKFSTEIYINGEYQGTVVQGAYGFWYSIALKANGIECRSKDEAIDFIKDSWRS